MHARFLLIVAALFATIAASSCTPEEPDDGTPDETDAGICDPGTTGCACDAGACDAGLRCDDDVCVAVGCPVGEAGCPCDDGACSAGGTTCSPAGLCENVSCPTGNEGCACRADDSCGRTASGQPLVCNDDDICASSRCAPGDTGCACLLGVTCNGAGASCDDGLCAAADCEAGTRNCPCAGGACNGDLRCFEDRVCVDAVGSLGGACFPDGRCLSGNRCQNDTCVPCSVGQQGCACEVGDACVEGLSCEAGQCAATTGFARQSVTTPVCWTPCEGEGLQDGTTFRPCPADGLMAGCLPGMLCNDGTCVQPEGEPRTCDIHTSCPEFQACLDGRCVSNCQSNSDCVSSADCDNKVCRKRCTIVEQNCPAGTFCSTDDGEAGHCVETVDPGEARDAAFANLFLSTTAVVMSSSQTNGSFRLTNDSPVDKHIQLSKRFERSSDGGEIEVTRLGPTVTTRLNPAACVPGTLGCRCSTADTKCVTTPLGMPLTCSAANLCTLPTCTEGTAGCVCTDGTCERVCEGPDCPLSWLTMAVRVDGAEVGTTDNVSLDFDLPSGSEAVVVVSGAGGSALTFWDGEIGVDEGTAAKGVQVSYARLPEGAWSGEMYTFGDFRVNEAGLANWMAKKDAGVSSADINGIKNAFLQAWANFRRGTLPFDKFAALSTSTRTESWRSPTLADRCGSNKVCYPFLNADGFETYTADPSGEPVPSGVVALPFGMNIEKDRDDTTAPANAAFTGRVRTSAALHYGANPTVDIDFVRDPATCSVNNAAGCLVFVKSFKAETTMGGRYRNAACTSRYEQTRTPWLVPGFVGGTVLDGTTGRRFVQECRDTLTPFNAADNDDAIALNTSLAGGNPMLDGRERKRTMELVDGALVNSDTVIIIYKETIPALVGNNPADDLTAYGYMFLTRESSVLTEEDLKGTDPIVSLPPPPSLPPLQCTGQFAGALANFNESQWAEKVSAIMGRPIVSSSTVIRGPGAVATNPPERVHYLCADTNRFDTMDATGCPQGSPITYFTVNGNQLSDSDVLNDSCRNGNAARGTCDVSLARFAREGKIIQKNAFWACANDNQVYCSDDRFDLRNDKKFFALASAPTSFPEIRSVVDDAFRYRTRFQDRGGREIGFAPSICVPGSDEIPYCYDPAGIEVLRGRMDCLLSLYVARPTPLPPAASSTLTALEQFLGESFAYNEVIDTTLNISAYHSGYEKLTAELEIMLGDDALTKALSSRFDLAGLSVASFPGSQLEPDGINLSGVAGAEMRLLYQATQHYSMVLDRFFELLPTIERILDESAGADIIDQASIETYFDRVIRASTQKAKAWNEISKRYQNLGRSDLATLVIERAYTAGTIESTVLSNLMINVAERSQVQFFDGILASIRKAQVSYSAALSDMRAQHRTIGEDVDYFGFPPDHIPFPAIEAEASRDNGFEVQLNRAQQRLELARQAEEAALSTTRSFDTDAASFQNELTRVENTYESQLSELCGTFRANGRVYPAIRKYASLDARAQLFGDPCGRMGTGQIHESLGGIDLALLEVERVRLAMRNLDAEISIEEERIDLVCGTTNAFRNATIALRNEQNTIANVVTGLRTGLAAADRAFSAAQAYANLSKCSVGTSTDCPTAAIASVGLFAAVVVNEVAQNAGAGLIASFEEDVRVLQNAETEISFGQQCSGNDTDYGGQSVTNRGIAQIESAATIKRLMLQASMFNLDALRESYDMQQAMARVDQLRNQAQRLQAEMEEVTQQTINVEAARNDPNVRIYKNDAVQTADTTFYSALREAFLATRVFEYHTSQSYADFGTLLLARMVSRGDFNLQSYLTGLEDAYRAFEDVQGVPDIRVAVLSLRDDMLKIPRLSSLGEPLSSADRIALLRTQLADPQLLDEHGYISIPFSTGPEDTSPLTRNHKVRFVEAEIVTTGSVDPLARVYLRTAGTSAVQGLDDELDYYMLPKRTAVINAFFSGDKVYDPSVYRSSRFADRPLFNTRWELILNTVDEPANDDLRTDDLTDVRIYLYYSDFTQY